MTPPPPSLPSRTHMLKGGGQGGGVRKEGSDGVEKLGRTGVGDMYIGIERGGRWSQRGEGRKVGRGKGRAEERVERSNGLSCVW